jgi:hypothetical protein
MAAIILSVLYLSTQNLENPFTIQGYKQSKMSHGRPTMIHALHFCGTGPRYQINMTEIN